MGHGSGIDRRETRTVQQERHNSTRVPRETRDGNNATGMTSEYREPRERTSRDLTKLVERDIGPLLKSATERVYLG